MITQYIPSTFVGKKWLVSIPSTDHSVKNERTNVRTNERSLLTQRMTLLSVEGTLYSLTIALKSASIMFSGGLVMENIMTVQLNYWQNIY